MVDFLPSAISIRFYRLASSSELSTAGSWSILVWLQHSPYTVTVTLASSLVALNVLQMYRPPSSMVTFSMIRLLPALYTTSLWSIVLLGWGCWESQKAGSESRVNWIIVITLSKAASKGKQWFVSKPSHLPITEINNIKGRSAGRALVWSFIIKSNKRGKQSGNVALCIEFWAGKQGDAAQPFSRTKSQESQGKTAAGSGLCSEGLVLRVF